MSKEPNMPRPFLLTFLLIPVSLFAQQQSGPVPIYHVTVTERTVKAINYQYRAEPTLIDFRGTVLLSRGKGLASVESKQGHCEIDVHFENLTEPGQFGREYLTYVLWALTPDGRPINLGEVVANSGNKAHLRVTTESQAFAMIVTAEPYSAVRQPSDVVVLENQVRPDTLGKIEEVTARYELLPRGQYSWQIPDQLSSAAAQGPKVSMRKYEALLEMYQAQNAVGIAGAAHAQQYAPNTFAKAQQLLAEAQQLNAHKGDNARIVEDSREAAQAAEDARLIAVRHQQEDQSGNAQSQIAAARRAQQQAEQEVERLRADARAARAQADAERAAREQAEADAVAARAALQQQQPVAPTLPSYASPSHTAAPAPPPRQTQPQTPAHTEMRMRLLEQCNGQFETRDTPRGLVSVVPNSGFSAADLRAPVRDRLSRIAAIVIANPGLRVEVEGHSDSEADASLSSKRADAVRDALIRRGISPNAVNARGLGSSRPLMSSTTAAGREANARVEIVISGDPIGNLPFWDHTYPLKSGSGR
jgi:outer membrane protein OmpA-like peptidoglycan-associated protein